MAEDKSIGDDEQVSVDAKTSRIKQKYTDPTINLAFDTIDREKQAIIFANTKPSAEKTAEDIALKRKAETIRPEAREKLKEVAEAVLKVLSKPTKQCERLAVCIKRGIAFHHAGLAQKQKEIIQEEFLKGNIRIIAATPTLAAGVDLPAFRTILKSLKRFTSHGMDFIPVLEYLQMAGRAGRPKFDDHGEAIVIAKTMAEKEKLWEKYILGEPEEIYSKLAAEPALRFYLLSLIAGNFVRTKSDIMAFFKETFWAHQYGDMSRLEAIIDKILDMLDGWGFVRETGEGKKYAEKAKDPDFKDAFDDPFVSADEVGADRDVRYKATPLGKRVSELYLDPLTAHGFIKAMRKADSMQRKGEISIFSFLHMVSYTIELRPLLRVKVKEYEDVMERFAKYEDYVITEEPSRFDIDYDEFINSVKTALFFMEWVDEKTEDLLLLEYDIRPGEVKAKLDIADWLVYSSVELAKILQFREMVKALSVVRTRLKYGVKEELLPLLKLKNIGRVRARKLYKNNIKAIADVKKADISTLATLIGRKTSEGIKEQLGQKVDKISKLKRKGQKGLV